MWTADVSAAGRRFVDPLGTPGRLRDGRATAAMVLGIVGVLLDLIAPVGAIGDALAGHAQQLATRAESSR